MNLKKGFGQAIIRHNIGEMIRAGIPRAAAIRDAHQAARDAFWRAHPYGSLPGYIYPHAPGVSGRNNPGRKSGVGGTDRKPNPVPPSEIAQARKLFEDFTGHTVTEITRLDLPPTPKVGLAVGTCDGILYTTERDGKIEKYIHTFKKNARPLFAVSHDGLQLLLIGGKYEFTEAGITDKV